MLHLAPTFRAATAAFMLAAVGAAQAADLTISVEGVASAEGRVAAAVYGSAATWLKGERVAQAQADATTPRTVLVLRDLPPGRYGVSVMHDKNGNGKVDTNVVGIPTEPFGASRDARGRMGPPAFDDAAIDVNGDTAITIHLQ